MHGTTCQLVDAPSDCKLEGDAILTSTTGLGIGVRTADCLPLALYDEQHHAAAVVHAGWRGAVAGVVPTAIKSMQTHFGTTPQGLTAYIGPCARWCCYEVGQDVALQVPKDALRVKEESTYLDMQALVHEQLLEAGIAPGRILCEDACTICGVQYHSYRRDGEHAGRNLTIMILK